MFEYFALIFRVQVYHCPSNLDCLVSDKISIGVFCLFYFIKKMRKRLSKSSAHMCLLILLTIP